MWRTSTQRRGHTVADLMKYDHTSPRGRWCRAEPVGMARWHHVFASPVNNEAGLIRKQSEMTQTLMSLLWSCSCNQMLIQFYVRLSFVSFLLGFGFHRQCVCLKETEIHKNEEATGCQRRTFKLLQTLTTSVLAFVSHLIFPFSPLLCLSHTAAFSAHCSVSPQ